MKLSKPFKNATPQSITQGFKLKDHEANDFGGKFGEFLVAPFNAKVINVVGNEIDMDTPDAGSLEHGYGIRLQSIEDPTYSCTYWHCQILFPVKKGDTVLMGQVVAMMGNSGFVLSNGQIVAVDRKLIPPFPGTHLHWSFGRQVGTEYTPLDPSQFIDWTIPINYSLAETLNLFVLSFMSLFKNGR